MWQYFVHDVIDRMYYIITFISKYFFLRRAGVPILADIIKILTMFIITIYKDSRKVKINWNYVSKCTLYPYFLIWQYLLIYREKMLIPAEFKGCVMWFIYFLDLLWVKHNCATFHHCRICLTDFRDGAPSIREQPQKSPSWIGLKVSLLIILLSWHFLRASCPNETHFFDILETLKYWFGVQLGQSYPMAGEGATLALVDHHSFDHVLHRPYSYLIISYWVG